MMFEESIPPLPRIEDYPRIHELRRELVRWINIQTQMHGHSLHQNYLHHMRVIHKELDRLELAMQQLNCPYPYREGQRTRRVIVHPGTPEYNDMLTDMETPWVSHNRRIQESIRRRRY